MLHIFKTFIDQTATITALGFVFLAHTYLDAGSGLHPFISMPAATLALMLPYFFREDRNQ